MLTKSERDLSYFAQIILNGAHNGALYALLAYGYILTYQVTKRANFAHGAVFAFTGQNLILFTAFGWNTLYLIFPLALGFGALMAGFLSFMTLLLLARTVFPPIVGRSPNTMIAVSLGVAISLAELARIAADTRDFWLKQFFAAPVEILPGLGVRLTQIQLFDLAMIAAALTGLEFFMRRSATGRNIRAVADDALAAEMLGVNVSAVFTSAVVGGGGCAVLAGIVAACYFGNLGFGAGLVFGLKVLFISAAGGFSAPAMAAGGAFLIGLSEALWDGYFPTIYRDAALYLFLTFVLAARNDASLEKMP
jgi:branched-chain amino acid transport system permease protein